LSINDYILKLKTSGHSLAAIGKPLTDKDLLLAILNGLDHDYETVVSLITYQMDEIDLEKVQYLLLMHEQRLSVKNLISASSLNSVMHANVASSNSQNNTGFGESNRGGYLVGGNNFMNRGGRGRGRASNRQFFCQLCGKPDHFVD